MSVLYLAAAQAIYNFALRPQGIRSSVEFHDALCTCKLGAAKYGERVGPEIKPATVNFDLGLFGLAPLPLIQKLFYINFLISLDLEIVNSR